MNAQDMSELLGFRYMLGEMEVLKGVVNQAGVQDSQLAAIYGEDEGGRTTGSEYPEPDDDWC